MHYRIASWNVNGIRACNKKGFKEWVYCNNLDIVCIQENKAQMSSLSPEDYTIAGYTSYWAEAEKKGYSGVSVWVKSNINIISIKIGIDHKQSDAEGRTIIIETNDFYLINGYFPNGRDDHSRVEFKLEYSYKILELAKKLRIERPVIICGDINTAHKEIDLSNPASNKQTTGFLPNERKYLDDLIENDFMDIYRIKEPEKIVYSWWSYRSAARERNIGWRIDYFIVDKSLLSSVKKIEYQNHQYGSDHCPIILELFI